MEFLIKQYVGWETADPAAIRGWMAEETTVLRSARKNANEMMILLGTKTANMLTSALNAAGLPLIPMALATPDGIDFGHPETQAALDDMAVIPGFAPLVGQLKAIGQDTRTRWARVHGDAALPTIGQVAEAVALAKSNDAKAAVRQWRDTALLPAIDAAINAGKTIAQIQAEISAL